MRCRPIPSFRRHSIWSKPGIDNLKFDVACAKKILGDAGYVLVGNALHYPAGVKETVTDN